MFLFHLMCYGSLITILFLLLLYVRKILKIDKELLRTKNQLQNILNTVGVCIWSLDVSSGTMNYNSSAKIKEIFGLPSQSFHQNPMVWKKLMHPEDLQKVEEGQKAVLEGRNVEVEHRIIKSNNEICWITTKMIGNKDKNGNVTQIEGISLDTNERNQLLLKNEYMATHDSLTDLPNRSLFEELCLAAIARANWKKTMLAILFVDLDRFKDVNDNYGHATGDSLLQSVSKRLRVCIRETDTVARMGGDEFAFLMVDIITLEDVKKKAQRIVHEMSRPFFVNEHELTITASSGISIYPSDGKDMSTLLEKADIAMYKVKEEGKNNYRFYSNVI